MAEGPVNFGKPLLILVVVGCLGGGYYAFTHWPSHYEGNGWDVDFPHGWEVAPFNDPNYPGKVAGKGPLVQEGMEGVCWVTLNYHGTLDWPGFVFKHVPQPDKQEDTEIAHKRSLIFEYEADGVRYMGSAVQRGDAVVICVIGCVKHLFEENREKFDKCVKSVRCSR